MVCHPPNPILKQDGIRILLSAYVLPIKPWVCKFILLQVPERSHNRPYGLRPVDGTSSSEISRNPPESSR